MNKKLSKLLTMAFEGNGTEILGSQKIEVNNDFMDHSAKVDSGIQIRLFSAGDDYVIDLEASRSITTPEGESDTETARRQVFVDKDLVDSTIGFITSLIKLANSGKGVRIVDPDATDEATQE